jgi:hypothetical protein
MELAGLEPPASWVLQALSANVAIGEPRNGTKREGATGEGGNLKASLAGLEGAFSWVGCVGWPSPAEERPGVRPCERP